MALPKISVITVTYNCEAVVEATLLSVAAQSYPNVEHIIIDGQSSDQTFSIITSHRGNIIRCLSEPDNGLYDAMNKGLDLATGDYALFLNAGDVFASADVILALIQGANDLTSIIYGYVEIDAGFAHWYSPYEGAKFKAARSYLPHHQSILYPSAYFKKYRFDLRFPTQADILFTFQACQRHQTQFLPVATVKSILGGYSTHLFKSLHRAKALISELSEIAAIQWGGEPRKHRFRIATNIYIKFASQQLFGDMGLFHIIHFNAFRSSLKRRIFND